jgi:hypothetical protein
MSIYPTDLLEDLKQKWSAKSFNEEVIPTLPDDKIINKLLDVCYHASFETEETRRLKFKVAYYPNDAVEENLPYIKIELNDPKPFDKKELLRIAPAIDPKSVIIGVEWNESKQSLQIWGFINIGSDWWNFIHGNTDVAFSPPNALTISSQKPGDLLISRQGTFLLFLSGGNLHNLIGDIFHTGPIAMCSRNTDIAVQNEIKEQLMRETVDLKIPDPIIPIGVFTECVKGIIFNILEQGHGGTLILIPDTYQLLENLKDHVKIKYPCNYENLANLSKSVMKTRILRRVDPTKPYEDFLSDSENLSESINFVSSLAGVDGAILLTDRLKLLGFGCELITKTSDFEIVKKSSDTFGNDTSDILIETFGTRHRSAFRFCSHFDNAIAFIFSQDGGVTVSKKCKNGLIIWQDINIDNWVG